MPKTVYEKTYRNYLAQLEGLDLTSVGEKLGCKVERNEVLIPLFGKPYKVSKRGIFNPSGKKPDFDQCVILCKHLLLCPNVPPKDHEWVSYPGLKDSGPLTKYFANEVERAIAQYFRARVDRLVEASATLGGSPPAIQASYDFSAQFDALPRVPLVLLYNDADEEFPAKCSVLFENRAEHYLDAECLAMVGRLLFTYLKEAADLHDTVKR
jgi:hypothetical protein